MRQGRCFLSYGIAVSWCIRFTRYDEIRSVLPFFFFFLLPQHEGLGKCVLRRVFGVDGLALAVLLVLDGMLQREVAARYAHPISPALTSGRAPKRCAYKSNTQQTPRLPTLTSSTTSPPAPSRPPTHHHHATAAAARAAGPPQSSRSHPKSEHSAQASGPSGGGPPGGRTSPRPPTSATSTPTRTSSPPRPSSTPAPSTASRRLYSCGLTRTSRPRCRARRTSRSRRRPPSRG